MTLFHIESVWEKVSSHLSILFPQISKTGIITCYWCCGHATSGFRSLPASLQSCFCLTISCRPHRSGIWLSTRGQGGALSWQKDTWQGLLCARQAWCVLTSRVTLGWGHTMYGQSQSETKAVHQGNGHVGGSLYCYCHCIANWVLFSCLNKCCECYDCAVLWALLYECCHFVVSM